MRVGLAERRGAESATRRPTFGPSLSNARRSYLRVLTCCFTVFNSARVVAYLPNVWSICQQADSSQHSLLTWLVLLGANATMAAWLYEQNGQRVNRAIAINIGNSAMCLLTAAVIAVYRL